jgi:hypothetical protein
MPDSQATPEDSAAERKRRRKESRLRWKKRNPDKVRKHQADGYARHKDKRLERQREWHAENRELVASKWRKKASENPRIILWYRAKARAKKKGIPFTISPADIVVPYYCPALGIRLARGTGIVQDRSPSLDRINPRLGYIPGNICVISHRANSIKRNATAKEISKILTYIKKHHG